MDDESQPNSFSQDVETGNGVTKHVVAQNQQELDEAVQAIKDEHADPAPDILDPADGNKIVSPDNKHTEDIPSEVDNDVEVDGTEVEDQQSETETPDEQIEVKKPRRSTKK